MNTEIKLLMTCEKEDYFIVEIANLERLINLAKKINLGNSHLKNSRKISFLELSKIIMCKIKLSFRLNSKLQIPTFKNIANKALCVG